MSASEQPSAFPAGHDPRPETPPSNPPMTKAAMMQARRKSRGMSDAAPPMLRPDYVFPPPASVSVSVSAANRTSQPLVPHTLESFSAHNTTASSLSSLAPPSLAQKSQHLKTHYRTHSRNGSTVTVQDLKQAIAAVKTDLFDITHVSTSDGSDAIKTGSALERNDTPPSTSISVAIATTGEIRVEERTLGELPGLPPLSSFSSTSTYVSRTSGSSGKFDALKRHSSVDSFASSTPLPSLSTRPSSMILNRTRDRTNVSVPPFFSYSIPHEFPSPYTSPRLKLPGAEPVSLPISPFARKRKHTYHYTTRQYPSSEIVVKLSGKNESTLHLHKLTVGDVPEVELIEHGYEHTSEQEQEQQEEQDQESTPTTTTFTKDQDTHTETEVEGPQHEGKGDESMSEATQVSESEAESVASLEPSLEAPSTADKRMSWASMVSMDEDLNLLTKAIPVPASQPYRPPGSRLRAAASFEPKPIQGANPGGAQSRRKSFSEHQHPARRPSPTHGESFSSSPTPPLSTPGHTRKPAPTPLKLVGSNHSDSHTQNKSAPSSPTTPFTPSRRRRSRSRKNQKDKEVEPQVQPSDNNSEPVVEVGDTGPTEGTVEPKKARTRSRSRSRSRSRNRANAENNIPTEVPPVPQTPSWVPVHNMNVASQSGPTTATLPLTAPPSEAPPSETPLSPTTAPTNLFPSANTSVESNFKRRGPRPSRLLSTRSSHNLQLQTLNEDSRAATFSPRSREASSDYFSMRPLQPPRTPMTPGGDGDDDDHYYRLQMVTTPMIQNGFFPNWAKGDAQLEELERIRNFLSARQYPNEMPLSDEWTLFFSDTSRAKDKSQVQDAYSSAITPLFTCHTVPQFATSWKYVRERVRPATMKVNQNLHWFKKGIKPMWEDPQNKYGGRLTLCPPRALLDVVWETVLILMAGDVLDHHGEGTGAVFARRARGDRVEVWLGSDDTPEALAHIRGVLIQELTASGADELVRAAKYKKHFDGRRDEKKQSKENQANGLQVPGGSGSGSGSASPLPSPLPTTPMAPGSEDKDTHAFLAQQQQQQPEKQQQCEREREQAKEQERIMQLGKERLEKERAEKDRLREERVRALAAAAMAAAEAKHQQQLQQQLEREQQ
ncbi:hypothetical protein BG006_010379 [Podila minutissima]|uniref:Eukaryotic translation initiation factor 4E n=1 Tax=Podila minutissima TaxID=64525 RepID=A0A9P5VIN3_9FUNG|nr:hypothetical protein BG006_010379 [Podila minutissima]